MEDKKRTRAELVALVQQLGQSNLSEEEDNCIYQQLREALLDQQLTDYVFWPDRPMTAEEILDRALAHRTFVAGWTAEPSESG